MTVKPISKANKERLTFFAAGTGFGVIILMVILALITGCRTIPAAPGEHFIILTPGTTIIETPCAIVVIEFRTNAERTTFFWRVGVIPRVTIPPTPAPKGQEA